MPSLVTLWVSFFLSAESSFLFDSNLNFGQTNRRKKTEKVRKFNFPATRTPSLKIWNSDRWRTIPLSTQTWWRTSLDKLCIKFNLKAGETPLKNCMGNRTYVRGIPTLFVVSSPKHVTINEKSTLGWKRRPTAKNNLWVGGRGACGVKDTWRHVHTYFDSWTFSGV